jgi:hypothetical protein
MVPLLPSALGYHDASDTGAGGVWFLAQGILSRGLLSGQLLVWCYQWPQHIANHLITNKNPHGTISISDLELTGGLLHLDVICQCYDTCKITISSKNNTILPTNVSQALQLAVTIIGPHQLGFLPSDISACCQRAAGATAILYTYVHSCHIQLLGCW